MVAGVTVLAALANLHRVRGPEPAADSPPHVSRNTEGCFDRRRRQSYTSSATLVLPPHGLATAVHLTIHGAHMTILLELAYQPSSIPMRRR